jgi:hypothetical protein
MNAKPETSVNYRRELPLESTKSLKAFPSEEGLTLDELACRLLRKPDEGERQSRKIRKKLEKRKAK